MLVNNLPGRHGEHGAPPRLHRLAAVREHHRVHGLHPPVPVQDTHRCGLGVTGFYVGVKVVLDVQVSSTGKRRF